MRVPPLKLLRYALEAAGVYLVYGVFSLMPFRVASRLGGALLGFIGPCMGASRRVMRNLDAAFPHMDAGEKRRILVETWENLGRVIAEYPHLARIQKDMEIAGGENVPRAGGVIFFGAHLANWEAAPAAVNEKGRRLALVYRRPNNFFVDGLLVRARGAVASAAIPKGAAGAREILSVIRKGGGVGMLLDQKQNEGIPVPFFGRNAMTAPAAAHFALKTGCPLIPVRVERVAGARLRATVFPPMDLKPTGDREADAARIMGEVNAMIESWVRERPGQWLWLHRRWPD